MNIPVFSPDRNPQTRDDVAEALEWLGQAVYAIGPGFHPDTSGNQYVENESGARSMTDEQALQFDLDSAEVAEILEDNCVDIYHEAHYFMWRLNKGMPLAVVDDSADRAEFEKSRGGDE